MDCPACGEKMVHRHPGGIEVDICRRCRGVWLDATEFDGVLGVEEGRSVEAQLDESAKLPDQCRYCGVSPDKGAICGECDSPLGLKCPRDKKEMYVVEVAGLELDRCPSCKGLWVDGFERSKLGGMRREIEKMAVPAQESDGAAAVVGLVAAGGVAGGEEALDGGFFGIGGGDDSDVDEAGEDSGEAVKQMVDEPSSMKEYIKKYGEFEITCNICSEELTRYSAWHIEDEYYCLPCAKSEDLVKDTLKRSGDFRPTAEDYWHDEEHLRDFARWIIGGIFRWRKDDK